MAKFRLKTTILGAAVVIVTVGSALLLTNNVRIIGVHMPFAFFYAAVAVSTWFGGRWAGVASIVLGGVCTSVFILHTNGRITTVSDAIFVQLTFAAIATLTLLLASGYRGAANKLTDEEARIKILVEQNPLALFHIDPATLQFIWANQAAIDLYGYSLDEFLTMTVRDVRPRKEHDDLASSMAIADESGRAHYLTRNLTKSGGLIDIEIFTHDVQHKGRQIREVMVIDIRDKVNAEKALAHSREQLDGIVSSAMDAIISTDSSGKIIVFNEAAEKMFLYTSKEALGMDLGDLIPHRFRDDHIHSVSEFSETGTDGEIALMKLQELFGLRSNGDKFPAEISISTVKIGGESLHTAIVRDITSRVQAMQDLTEAKKVYDDLAENSQDFIYTHDLKGNYISINRYGLETAGYTLDEAVTMNMANILDPESLRKAQTIIERTLKGEVVNDRRLVMIAKDGRRIDLDVNIWMVYENGVPSGIRGIARDVTERLRIEERLRTAQKLESIGTLAGGIAHDFNNLMTIVTGYSELGIRSVSPEDPVRSKLETIRDAGHKAAELTHQLLAFSRKQLLQPEPVDLNAAVKRITKLLERLLPEHIVLETELAPQLGTIKADPSQVEQVILNLAVNARDEMPTGGNLTIRTRNVGYDEAGSKLSDQIGQGSFVMVSITDTGPGMDEETVRRVFDPYFSLQGIGHGGGLGLATVHGIVKQSGGEITVRSEIGRGTTFDVIFPATAIVEPDENTDEIETGATGGGEVVLVVEDNEIVRPVVLEMLNSLGYVAIPASGGAEAIAICQARKGPIDLLLTDVIMPEMSGKQLMDELEKLRPEIKCLFMSGYADEVVFVDGAVEPGSAFLEKPFNVLSLNEKIREVLDRGVTENAD